MKTPRVQKLVVIPELRDALNPWLAQIQKFYGRQYTLITTIPENARIGSAHTEGLASFGPEYDIVQISDGVDALSIKMQDAAVVRKKLPLWRQNKFLMRMQAVVDKCTSEPLPEQVPRALFDLLTPFANLAKRSCKNQQGPVLYHLPEGRNINKLGPVDRREGVYTGAPMFDRVRISDGDNTLSFNPESGAIIQMEKNSNLTLKAYWASLQQSAEKMFIQARGWAS